MDFIEILKAILFGIVEGITEWLPISSTGHMIILDELVKKGELTVEQGKVLNQELKHNIKSTVKNAADSVKESAARKNEQEELKATISKLTPEQLAAVKAQIESMQAEAAAKEEEVPVAEPVEDAATETVEEEKTEAAGGSEEAPEAE